MGIDPKHTTKATRELLKAKKLNVFKWPSQSPDLKPTEFAFPFLKTNLQAERPMNKQQVKVAAVKAWQSISQEEAQHLVMSMGTRLKQSLTAKELLFKY